MNAPAPVPAPGEDEARIRALLGFCDRAAWWLDDCIGIPFTRFRVGLDAIVGLIPLAGDGLALAVSLLTLWKARAAGVPKPLLGKMLRNVVIDFFGSLLPILGDAFDAVFKSHRRNFELLREHYGARYGLAPAKRSRWPRLLGLLVLALLGWWLWRYLHG